MNLPDNIEHLSISLLIPAAMNAKLHSDGQVAQLAASIREFETGIGWNVEAVSGPSLTDLAIVQESLMREFNLPLSRRGRRLNRHTDIIEALTPCLL